MKGRCRSSLVVAGVAALVPVFAAQAQLNRPRQGQGDAQQPTIVTPPRPGTADRPPTIWLIFVAVALGAGIVGTALIPSKRGHQD